MNRITDHARDRMEQHLFGIVKSTDVKCMVQAAQELQAGKHYICTSELDSRRWITVNGKAAWGDAIVAIIKDGMVQTVMLTDRRQRWQDGTFQNRSVTNS